MNLTLALSCAMTTIWLLGGKCETTSEYVRNSHRRFHKPPFLWRFGMEDRIREDDTVALYKRQLFDDYDHMRFGKREQFDDYDFMRFGRNRE